MKQDTYGETLLTVTLRGRSLFAFEGLKLFTAVWAVAQAGLRGRGLFAFEELKLSGVDLVFSLLVTAAVACLPLRD